MKDASKKESKVKKWPLSIKKKKKKKKEKKEKKKYMIFFVLMSRRDSNLVKYKWKDTSVTNMQ